MQRIEALGRISEEEGRLTRTFCSPAMREANDLVVGWMREAGMQVRKDAIANLIGHYPSPKSKVQNPKSSHEEIRKQKTLLLGSHLDTVRDAGKFDGPLGVLVAIACVEHLRDTGTELPFAIEVIGFADEEGVRYQSTCLGSRVLAGAFHRQDLLRLDVETVAKNILELRDPLRCSSIIWICLCRSAACCALAAAGILQSSRHRTQRDHAAVVLRQLLQRHRRDDDVDHEAEHAADPVAGVALDLLLRLVDPVDAVDPEREDEPEDR